MDSVNGQMGSGLPDKRTVDALLAAMLALTKRLAAAVRTAPELNPPAGILPGVRQAMLSNQLHIRAGLLEAYEHFLAGNTATMVRFTSAKAGLAVVLSDIRSTPWLAPEHAQVLELLADHLARTPDATGAGGGPPTMPGEQGATPDRADAARVPRPLADALVAAHGRLAAVLERLLAAHWQAPLPGTEQEVTVWGLTFLRSLGEMQARLEEAYLLYLGSDQRQLIGWACDRASSMARLYQDFDDQWARQWTSVEDAQLLAKCEGDVVALAGSLCQQYQQFAPAEEEETFKGGVHNPNTIDLVAERPETNECVLIMIETRPWEDPHTRTLQLSKKVANYVAFSREQMRALYPQCAGKTVLVQLNCSSAPPPELEPFLESMAELLQQGGMRFAVNVLS